MSSPSPRRQRLRDAVDDRPLRGGLTGIGLVAVATIGVAAASALLVLLILVTLG